MDVFIRALQFAAEKHRHQTRKDAMATPYINHPIQVAHLLWSVAKVRDIRILAAALLHDTLEDTNTTVEELQQLFGTEICAWVQEVSDDKNLPKALRKQLQVQHAPHLSTAAKLIKLADKIANIQDIGHSPPLEWSLERRLAYLDWSNAVVNGLHGVNHQLEQYFIHTLSAVRQQLSIINH